MNAIHFHRIAHALDRHAVPVLPQLIHRMIFLLFNCWLAPRTQIGTGTWLAYGGMGVVVHQDARVGRNVLVAHQVTIGGRSGSQRMPVIEDDVYLGAGCRVLGPVTVGWGAFVAPNAVVTADVPPGVTVGGVPARVLKERSDAAATIAGIMERRRRRRGRRP